MKTALMKTAQTLLAIAAFVIPAIPAFAADYSLTLRPEDTKVLFTVTDPLHTVRGTFNLRRGKIDFNSDTGKASGEIVVDTASADSGSHARDSRLHSNVLETQKYPDAVFTPDRIDGSLSLSGESTVKVHGIFTIHGAPHDMTMDVHTSATADKLHANITFQIPYVKWGMKDPSNFLLKVGKTVDMAIETTGALQKR